jgi:hypothetical protein
MKNFILNLVVVAFISFSASAQKDRGNEEVRAALAKGMVSFVETVKPAYKAGQTYDQFQSQLCGLWKPTAEGSALLRKTHELLSKNTSSLEIQKSYSGKEFGGAYLRLKAIQKDNPKADGIELFGGTTGDTSPFNKLGPGPFNCKWWDLPCHLANLLAVLQENQVIVCIIAGFFGLPCVN